MRVVIQRVNSASVSIDGKLYSSIEKGILALIGISPEDDESVLRTVAEKMLSLRIFTDQEDKMNLSLSDVGGKLLAVSQFTLYADCRKGRRPSFTDAAGGEIAEKLYNRFIEICEEILGQKPMTGEFGADMKISLENDGPVTIILDSKDLNIKKV
ncbi:MAG: D-tyrosyl-tRNA(Tyr) deacylase [Clostridia bacterium]|nr:D-tyrosyl-tRNA(Tyr) deacylase [Clostridia bacterium]